MNNVTQYAQGTNLQTRAPWGVFVGGRALCSDGKVRRLARIAICADTAWTISGAVKVNGKTVSGFVSVEMVSGSSVWTEDDPAIVRFHALPDRANDCELPVKIYAVPSGRRFFILDSYRTYLRLRPHVDCGSLNECESNMGVRIWFPRETLVSLCPKTS